ncbi:MBL fold metallo-hydrolase [Leptospira langatensis]|uniref:MBL fold metallo-hydrolase n=1 Tax=Leptospira langatensis TaxID=2484983 RepID=A0A5F1ZSD0_9LEPT|nr:MBL fold metallo-hydrolase [Leptospira langatensis]TGJ98741.1 MBL fold metallo-hydrolase [Leptospira langatensis]TGL40692.1 MBL fold metallo-hydrolase [Leptospira langatensis]
MNFIFLLRFLRIAILSFVLLQNCLTPSGNILEYKAHFVQSDPEDIQPKIQNGKIRVTYLGTSSLLLDDGETQILTDGFFSRPSLFRTAFRKISSNEEEIKYVMLLAGIKKLKAIFVCHSHYDHSMDAPFIAKETNSKLFGSISTLQIGRGEGLPEEQMALFEPGKKIQIGKFRITVLESKHTPPFRILGKTNASDPNRPHLTEPLKQPAKAEDYIEGGTYDFLVEHGKNSLLIKGSTNYLEGAWKDLKVDVLFLGIAMLGKLDEDFQNKFYTETVGAVHPKIVIPVHWDNFFKPLSEPLEPNLSIGDDVKKGMEYMIQRTSQDGIQFQILRGFGSILLF